VIGGGPAGLSVAYQLARKGHAVTIFDERAELGGMMRYGIPGFRTPRACSTPRSSASWTSVSRRA
jgi:NADPH-dependent glutamate synthase beta subunit-like oxidoreductase